MFVFLIQQLLMLIEDFIGKCIFEKHGMDFIGFYWNFDAVDRLGDQKQKAKTKPDMQLIIHLNNLQSFYCDSLVDCSSIVSCECVIGRGRHQWTMLRNGCLHSLNTCTIHPTGSRYFDRKLNFCPVLEFCSKVLLCWLGYSNVAGRNVSIARSNVSNVSIALSYVCNCNCSCITVWQRTKIFPAGNLDSLQKWEFRVLTWGKG